MAYFKVFLLVLLLKRGNFVGGASVSDFTAIEVGNNCLYVSNYKIWPYIGNDMTTNVAKSACTDLYLALAVLESPEENKALQEFSRCKLALPKNENILINLNTNGFNPSGLDQGKNCYFQKADGSHEATDDKNCQDWFTDGEGKTTEAVHFVCKKKAKCAELPKCKIRPKDPEKCDIYFGKLNYADAKTYCDESFGYLPRMVSELDYQIIPEGSWVGLTTDANPIQVCGSRNMDKKGVSLCIASQQNFYWDGGKVMPKLPLSFDQARFMRDMHVDTGEKCLIRIIGMMHDHDCDSIQHSYCTIDLGPKGMGQNLAQPNHFAGTFTCASPPDPPTTPNMILDTNQPDIMCTGQKARYTCNVGGVNVREDEPSNSLLEVECSSSLTYDIPSPWPICIDRLDCPEPIVDDLTMKHDWNSTKGLTPDFSITYECLQPHKKVISLNDLQNEVDSNLAEMLAINCQINGTYDKNINDYACTRSCPVQNVPDPNLMKHDWNNSEANPEIYQEVRYSCRYGRHLVHKKDFATGKPTSFLDDLLTLCQIDGWLNNTIGEYTCTRGCDAPLNYSEVFGYDWDPSKGSDIGTTVKYACNNPNKMVVDLTEDDSPLNNTVEAQCLYNGQYSIDIVTFGCTECNRRNDPPNGKITCESRRYEEGKRCVLECDSGYIPIEKTSMTCKFDASLKDYIWDVDEDQFTCIDPIALIVGGEDSEQNYLRDVEVLSPGFDCPDAKIAPYPLKVTGASAGFAEGQTLVCGGGVVSYTDCITGKERSQICARNIECVTTAGGSKWCTGPKTDACYTFDPSGDHGWTLAVRLRAARAYAASAVTKDGSFWLIGGTGIKDMLKSSEKLNFIGGQWRRAIGPSLPVSLSGACASPMNLNEVVVAGGYSMETSDYNEKAYILDVITKTWYSKPWSKLRAGPRFDMACHQVNWNGEKVLVTAGGWNNSAVGTTEIFKPTSLKFSEVLSHDTSPPRAALPVHIRSSVMTELDSTLVLAGGVICTGNSKQKQNCQRTGKVYRLMKNKTTSINGYDAVWEEDVNNPLKFPRSGHALLTVPVTYVPKCKRIIN